MYSHVRLSRDIFNKVVRFFTGSDSRASQLYSDVQYEIKAVKMGRGSKGSFVKVPIDVWMAFQSFFVDGDASERVVNKINFFIRARLQGYERRRPYIKKAVKKKEVEERLIDACQKLAAKTI